ncbi:MAG: transglycosylase SLT domain-containing protein [Edaphobacter sp.]|uniref:lytic transglycosylase domain-containing protein n=1 Tax=Edaphobacter sp. TaxID=1934404 RepID=UPI002392ABBE|nr:lytic transglycosylase domain-containing protein [Edaphobacter sp.]MDE1177077.1 transglycosylase SLT domain-containing protein [Edaphobacter sp.]
MHRLNQNNSVRRWMLAAACAPLVLLAGCPQNGTPQAGAPGKVPAQATAPTTPAANPAAPQTAAPGTGTAQSVNDAANAYKAQQLINRVEQSYRTGVENYRAGHLEAARADFDAAVDLMLTSGLDLKHDPQLADEFEHLLDSVNSLELAALKEGNGLSPVIEAAPLDAAANEVTFKSDAALNAQLNDELKTTLSDFPLVVNDYVAGYINYFSNSQTGHAHLLRSLERAGKYKDMIQKILREEGVPQDLIYLAVAESGFQPQALNTHSGAAGMWQFMPFAGAYGLARNGWVDERFDPEKSSRAYGRYMKSLYDQFGDWYLAMAAYDWGPGNVQRAVMKTGYADFWELYRRGNLPGETKNYVPGIIAAIIMSKNPTKYGLDKIQPMAAVVSDTVTIDYTVDLHLVADVTNASLEEIVALNPSLLRMNTPHDAPFDLHIPLGTRDAFTSRIKEIPEEKRSSWRFHVVRTGEALDTIASTLHARASEIAETNSLKPGESLEEGDELVVPVATVTSSHPQRYKVRRGDTLITVADRFGVSVEDLRSWNRLSSNTIAPGRTIAVAAPVKLAPSTRTRGRASRSSSSKTSKASSKSSSASSKKATKSTTKSSPAKSSSAKTSSSKTSPSSSKKKSKAAR